MIWLIVLLALTLRLFSINQSLWLDEAINVLATQNYSLLGMITEYAKGDFHPPGFFIILWIWSKLFGISEVVVRIPSIIFGVLTIYLVYLIGRKLHSKTLGLIAAFLLAINPLHIYYSQEARMYALAALAVSINFFILIKFTKKEDVNIIFLILSNLFVLLSDYVAYLIFPAQFIFLLFYKNKLLFKKWLLSLIGAIIIGSLWIPTLLNQLDVGAVVSSRLQAWKLIVGGFALKAVPLTLVKFIIGRISYPDKLVYGIILLPLCLLFLFLISRVAKTVNRSGEKLLFIWLIIPIFLGTIISLFIPIYSYFRLLFTLPAFVILTSLGIISFRIKYRYIILFFVTFVELFSSSVYLFNSSYQREDWRGLVNFLNSLEKNTLVLFESSGTLPPFDYYNKDNLNARGALKDFPAKNEIDLIELQNLHEKDIYLVNYLVDVSDPKRLVNKGLQESGYRITDTTDFHGVGFVYHYVK